MATYEGLYFIGTWGARGAMDATPCFFQRFPKEEYYFKSVKYKFMTFKKNLLE